MPSCSSQAGRGQPQWDEERSRDRLLRARAGREAAAIPTPSISRSGHGTGGCSWVRRGPPELCEHRGGVLLVSPISLRSGIDIINAPAPVDCAGGGL